MVRRSGHILVITSLWWLGKVLFSLEKEPQRWCELIEPVPCEEGTNSSFSGTRYNSRCNHLYMKLPRKSLLHPVYEFKWKQTKAFTVGLTDCRVRNSPEEGKCHQVICHMNKWILPSLISSTLSLWSSSKCFNSQGPPTRTPGLAIHVRGWFGKGQL